MAYIQLHSGVSRQWAMVVLSIVLAGCQAVNDGERPLLPLFSPRSTAARPVLAVLGPPAVVLTESQGPSPAAPSSIDTLRSCFVREQAIDLEAALQLAHLDNPRIALAEEVVRAHEAEQMLARSLLFPSLNAGTTLTLHQGALLNARGVVLDVNRESMYLGAGADVRGAGTVAVPGVRLVAHLGDAVLAPQAAEQRTARSRFEHTATQNNVLLEVAKTYLALVGAEARLLALRESEQEHAEVAKLTADFAAKGAGREADAQRAAAALALLQGTAQRAEEDLIARAAELARLLSADPAVRLRPAPGTPPLLQLVDDRQDVETLAETALANRPEIGARGADVASLEIRFRQERIRPLVPTISVGFSAGDFGGGSDLAGHRLGRFSSRTDLDILAVWTVHNLGMGNRAAQNKTRADIGQAEALRVAQIEQVRREVAEALAQSRASRAQMDIARRRVETAQKAFRQDLLRTKGQIGNLIETLSSLNLLTAARQDLVQTMVVFSQAQIQLYVALGRSPAHAENQGFPDR